MANNTEFLPNQYLVFEADQVLTNDHLNQLFNYLDQQNRWTRNKLIGIGVVCGLDIVQHTGVIEVTAGCGVTSQGYLIIQEDAKQYSYYMPYAAITQPNDLPFDYPGNLPFYKPAYDKKALLMLTDDEYDNLESDVKATAETIASFNKTLGDYVVVLFLEMNEMDLKNCDVFDCNDKGEKMQMAVRALLVKKSDLPVLSQDQEIKKPVLSGPTLSRATNPFTRTNPSATTKVNFPPGAIGKGFISPLKTLALKAPATNLKRFNVPYTDLKNTDNILDAFVKIVDDATLSAVASAYSYAYEKYKGLLDETANPFTDLFNGLKNQRDQVIKSYPLFIQYFYDFIDDLIKAYNEFIEKVSAIISACCPEENLFPLHLVLGEATANTKNFAKDEYRTYFIYSPLFARQGNEVAGSQFLFRRMQIMVSEFTIVIAEKQRLSLIKILPGLFQQALLSQRVIPYYYNIDTANSELYLYWNYYKTINGKATSNISYNAGEYSSDTAVTDPLLYDIEKDDFFRIEGHIGLNYQTALTNILQQRKNYNLPFDVVAISAEQLPDGGGTLPQCNMQDLDTDFKLIVSEFSCKVHTPFCFITKLPYPPASAVGTNVAAGASSKAKTATEENLSAAGLAFQKINMAGAELADPSAPLPFSTFKLKGGILQGVNFSLLQNDYNKGDFMRTYCAPAANTIGSVYLNSIKGGVFTNPVKLSANNSSLIQYYYFFQYVDAVESLMQVLAPSTLSTIDMNAFATAYKNLIDILATVIFSMAQFINNTFGNSDTAALQLFKEVEMDILTSELNTALESCIDERLQTLQDEYKARLQAYELQRSFYYYYNKHYGLEHKAGVPKGGTFVMVYHTAAGRSQGVTTGITGITANPGLFRTTESGIGSKLSKAGGITEAKLFLAKSLRITPAKKTTDLKNIASNIKTAKATKDTKAKEIKVEETKVEETKKTATELPKESEKTIKAGVAAALKDVATKDVITKDVATKDAATKDVITKSGATKDGATKDAVTKDVTTKSGATKAAASQPGTATTAADKTATINKNLLDFSTITTLRNFTNSSKDISVENRNAILDVLTRAQLQLTPTKYAVEAEVVIADFYVPYLCCSDCPPVAYIIPSPKEEIEFSLAPTEYVFNDENSYPFKTEPAVTDEGKQDPFSSADVLNPDKLHLATDDNNALFLLPAMPALKNTFTATVTYKNIPVSITIIRPDATFVINEITNSAGEIMLQPVPADQNADGYAWTVNDIDGIFENTGNPQGVSLSELKEKTGETSIRIALTLSYKRNEVIAEDTKEQTYNEAPALACIDFEPPMKIGTEFGSGVNQQPGDEAFTTKDNVVVRVWDFQFQRTGGTFNIARVIQAPPEFNKTQCISLNNINLEFDYSKRTSIPGQVTVDFFDQGGSENFSVNKSKVIAGELKELPAVVGGVKIKVDMINETQGKLTMKGKIEIFRIGGQEFFIDNVCAE